MAEACVILVQTHTPWSRSTLTTGPPGKSFEWFLNDLPGSQLQLESNYPFRMTLGSEGPEGLTLKLNVPHKAGLGCFIFYCMFIWNDFRSCWLIANTHKWKPWQSPLALPLVLEDLTQQYECVIDKTDQTWNLRGWILIESIALCMYI